MIEDKELAQLFKAESAEHLARLDDGLLRLEKTPADQALLEDVFRESHSLKGAARMLGLAKIETAAHGLESILNTARKGEVPLTPDSIESMNVVLGSLRKLVDEAFGGTPAGVHAGQASGAQAVIPDRSLNPNNPLDRELPVGAALAANGIRQQAGSCEGIGGGDVVAPNGLSEEMEGRVSPSGRNSTSNVPAPSLGQGEGGVASEPFRIETVRVETRKLDDLLTLAGELNVVGGRMQHRLSLMDELLEQLALLDRNRRKFQPMLRGTETDPKAHEALRQLRLEEGKMLAHFGERLKEAREAFYEDGARLEATSGTLEERVHAVRLLPLATVFTLFPRMVRDLAKDEGKEVELVIEGDDISVDKRILEEMKDPLMHLLRNAIDHGIETPAERERAGKPPKGTVLLRALQENNHVLLEVRDDGRGLDTEAIRRVALQRGLYDEATLASMTVAQSQQLIFLPGFSTSTFVTELSGRGVGLDVVRVNVERLKGEIRIKSAPHKSTSMQLRLPQSLSTTRLLLVSAGGHRYGLPIEAVHTSRRVLAEEIFSLEGHPAFEIDGQAIIAPRLADLLALPGESSDCETVCIVIQAGDERLGLRVDDLLDEEEVLTKPLGSPLRRVRNVSGLAILGSGEICAVLNPADLLRSARKLAVAPTPGKLARAKSTVKPCILLVEDTMLVRVMEKRILEDAGYEVVAAVDGMDALSALGQRPFAAVVSDITMPNMDGLTLTARIRQEPHYKDLPVVLVTSLSSDEDKRRGLEVGANAYIPKPTFDQRVLLDILQRLIMP